MASPEEHPASATHAGSVKTYILVFGALIVLTLLTAGAAVAPFPAWLHTPVALAIAAGKAGLVLLFFMHLRHSPWLVWLVAFGSLLWLAIMVTLTFADYVSRAWIPY
jgi:cytochrome c oxidase subunit IV